MRASIRGHRPGLALKAIERVLRQARLRDNRQVNIAVASVEAGMGQAADQMSAKQFCAKRFPANAGRDSARNLSL